jgi:aminopeptidase
MNFDEKLKTYAELIVTHGLNVQSDQIVNISTEAYHRDFALLVAEAAYKRGASFVNLDFIDPRLGRLRILKSREENLRYVPEYLGVKYRELVDQHAANLKLIGAEEPDILADLNPKAVNTVRLHQHLAIKYFYDEGIGKSLVHWTVASAATPKWGQKVFPELGPKQAKRRLWDEIIKACRADKPNCLALWQKHNQTLKKRAKMLTEMRIRELVFSGPDTNLIVALSPCAVFKGGSDLSPRGVQFEPNLPTEEIFTTPDCRGTSGKVKTTRPFLINGNLVSDLYLEFHNGEISHFSASKGDDTFREYISSDEGAKRLGEVALVGIDSPVFRSGLIFQEILFDENAACHIAVGQAYKFCLDGGTNMSKEELVCVGCNDSTVHTDMMISNDKVDVKALTYGGHEQLLIRNGAWVV